MRLLLARARGLLDVAIDPDFATSNLVYLSYSDRVIEGSPDNSITAVPLPAGTTIPMR